METQSKTLAKLTPALITARREMDGAVKKAKGNWGAYASLEDLLEACMTQLLDNGIVLTQPAVTIEGRNFVMTQLTHMSGEFMRAFTEIVVVKEMDPQKALAGQTYARRGGIESILSIPRVDDDGNHGNGKRKQESGKRDIQNPITPDDVNKFVEEVQGYITNDQREEFKNQYADSALSVDQIKYIFSALGIEDSKHIPADQYENLLDAMHETAHGRKEGIDG